MTRVRCCRFLEDLLGRSPSFVRDPASDEMALVSPLSIAEKVHTTLRLQVVGGRWVIRKRRGRERERCPLTAEGSQIVGRRVEIANRWREGLRETVAGAGACLDGAARPRACTVIA